MMELACLFASFFVSRKCSCKFHPKINYFEQVGWNSMFAILASLSSATGAASVVFNSQTCSFQNLI